MVKSKKMSKTSIAVIILALLLVLSMVLGLTGAWFTKSANSGAAETNSLVFGHVGDVEITAIGVEHLRDDGHGTFETVSSGPVMPGDKVTAGGVTFAHVAVAEGQNPEWTATESKVYFLIRDNNGTCYVTNVIDSGSDGIDSHDAPEVEGNGRLVVTTTAAQELKAGEEITIPGQIMAIQIGTGDNAKWYELDGVHDMQQSGTGADDNRYHSWEIPTSEQGVELNTYNAKVGSVVYNKNGVTYKIGIMQTTNATAEQAYDVLSVLLAA